MTKKDIIEKLKEYFINNSKFKEEKKNYFLSRRNLFKKGKKVNLKQYSITTYKYYKDYQFYEVLCKYLKELANQKGLEPYFLTLTRKSEFDNNIYQSIDSLKENMKIYREAFREITREFQRKNDILFLNIIEFTNDLFFHLHSIVFINPDKVEKFSKILENKIDLFQLGYEKKFKRINNKEDFKRTCKYLLKSIKTAYQNEEYAYLLDGAVNVLNYKLITHSKTKINKKLYFKLFPYIHEKFKNIKSKDEKYLNIYNYLSKNILIKNINKKLTKTKLKKLLRNYKKHNIVVFKESTEIIKEDEFVELQNKLLIKKIISHKNKEELLKNLDDYINSYIRTLKKLFSHKVLINFRWKLNSFKDILLKEGIKKFVSFLKTILLYRSNKYIYNSRVIIYIKNKKKKWEKMHDSANYKWIIKTN